MTWCMQRCKNCLQKAAFSCWLGLTNSNHTTWPKTHTHTHIHTWWYMQRCKNWLQKGAFSCWLVLTNSNHTSCCNECGAIGYCYFSSDKTKFRDTGFAAVFAVSVSIVKCCQKMLFVDRKMRIWSLAFHWEALCCKVMLIWREHSAAVSAVPLGTATSAVRKRSSGTQALLQYLPSAFPLWSATKRCSL